MLTELTTIEEVKKLQAGIEIFFMSYDINFQKVILGNFTAYTQDPWSKANEIWVKDYKSMDPIDMDDSPSEFYGQLLKSKTIIPCQQGYTLDPFPSGLKKLHIVNND